VNELLDKIAKLRKNKVTRASVVYSWVGRWIQPLQKCATFGLEYHGLKDPSRFSTERLYELEDLALVSRVLTDVGGVPYLPSKLSVGA